MYLKNIKFKNANGDIRIGKAMKCRKLIGILKKFPPNYLINTNNITDDLLVYDYKLQQMGYIDIAEDKFEEFQFE